MAKRLSSSCSGGFSLVELLVALVFTMILMAGMAAVFKASLSTFYTSGEVLSSVRRNRMSIDLLGDDLNNAAMYLVDLSVPPSTVATTPPFFVLPNMPIDGAGPNDPQIADELYFYMDQPLPFEGRLGPVAAPQLTAAELVVSGTAPDEANRTFTVDCLNSTNAKQVKKGQVFIFKDSWETAYISGEPTAGGSDQEITVVAGADPKATMTGIGSAGLPSKAKHLPQSGIIFLQPAQMVRYRVVMLQLDPTNANGIPCLVREQVNYGDAFAVGTPQQIITENVSGLKVYLSADAGRNWAGVGIVDTGFSAGWDQGIRAQLDTQLENSGRPDFKTTRLSDHWFRSIPTLVRVDVSTRTATQRTEYASVANTVDYKNTTQSLVFVPRHSGLTMN